MSRPIAAVAVSVVCMFATAPALADGLEANPTWILGIAESSAEFGEWVATAGDVNDDGFADVIVSAPREGQGFNTGSAFVYLGSAAGLVTTPAWVVDEIKLSVASGGDVNGDGFDDVIVGTSTGARVYHGGATGLSTTASWVVHPVIEDGNLGGLVDSAGDVNGDGFDDVVLASFFDNMVFVYHGSAAGLATTPAWSVTGAGETLGRSVAGAGDVDGDGYDDLIVGASYSNGQLGEGRAHVFHGSPVGLQTHPAWSFEPDVFQARFGSSVDSAGDVNADGFDDVIVGAPLLGNGTSASDVGRAYLFFGSASGVAEGPSWTVTGTQVDAELGSDVAGAGDVNGDGYDDILVGEPQFTAAGANWAGRARLFLGSASGPPAVADWTYTASGFWVLGTKVASAGDVDGDGDSDATIGAPVHPGGGVAMIFEGTFAGDATCGNGLVEGTEECDDGSQNSDEPGANCRTDCTLAGCGDGVVDQGEECDAGAANSDAPGATCRADCTPAGCGDGILDPDEECDLGPGNSDDPGAVCDTQCMVTSVAAVPTVGEWGLILMGMLLLSMGWWVFARR